MFDVFFMNYFKTKVTIKTFFVNHLSTSLKSYQMFIGYRRCPLIGDRLHWHIFGDWYHIGGCAADGSWHFAGLDRCDAGRYRLSLSLCTAGCCTCSSSSRLYRTSSGGRRHHSGRSTRRNDVGSGRAGQSDGHHVALVAGDAILLQLGDEAGVLGVLKQLAHLLVLLRVHLHVVLCEATFAVSADFSAEEKERENI